MIEAVNSVVANGPLLRGNAEQAGSAQSQAADLNQVDSVTSAPRAPYLSLVTIIDQTYNEAVYARRDSDTGDILRQIPSEERLAQIQRQRAQTSTVQRDVVSVSDTGRAVSSVGTQISEPSGLGTADAAPSQDVSVGVSTPRAGEAQIAAAAFANTAASAQPQIVSVSISA